MLLLFRHVSKALGCYAFVIQTCVQGPRMLCFCYSSSVSQPYFSVIVPYFSVIVFVLLNDNHTGINQTR
jgi:hypothetical protein